MWRWLLFGTLLACAGGDPADEPADLRPLPSCRQRTLATCDIRNVACQEALVEILGCVRGRTVSSLPTIEVIDLETARARFEAEVAVDAMMMPPTEFAEEDAVLTALGLIPPGVELRDAQLEEAIAGTAAYYTPATKVVTIIDRGRSLRSRDAVSTLVHELVHAAQDEESDLESALEDADTWEDYFALLALVEGEATFFELETAFWIEGAGADAPSIDRFEWEELFLILDESFQEELALTTAPIVWASEIAPYLYGTRWQWDRWFGGGDAAIVAALAGDAPASSAEFMRDPFRPGSGPALRVPVTCAAPEPPEGVVAATTTELGPALTYTVLRATGASDLIALVFAAQWQGDQLRSFGSVSGETLGLWRVQLATEEVAEDLARRLRAAGHRATARGSLMTAAIGDAAARDAWTWESDGPCAPPE